MPTPRTGPVAVEFNGEIYVFGGQLGSGEGSKMNEKYNPTTDTWTSRTGGNPLAIQDYGAEGASASGCNVFSGRQRWLRILDALYSLPARSSSRIPPLLEAMTG